MPGPVRPGNIPGAFHAARSRRPPAPGGRRWLSPPGGHCWFILPGSAVVCGRALVTSPETPRRTASSSADLPHQARRLRRATFCRHSPPRWPGALLVLGSGRVMPASANSLKPASPVPARPARRAAFPHDPGTDRHRPATPAAPPAGSPRPGMLAGQSSSWCNGCVCTPILRDGITVYGITAGPGRPFIARPSGPASWYPFPLGGGCG
jgi:hypothetical protein